MKKWIGTVCLCTALLWMCGCGVFFTEKGAAEEDVSSQDVSWKEKTWQEWQEMASARIFSQTYVDASGNRIVYYCCETVGMEQGSVSENTDRGSEKDWETDRDRWKIWSMILGEEEPTGVEECAVGEWTGFFCQKDGRSYLCWTISPQYHCVIEYDAAAVAQEEILRMAAGVVFDTEK